MSLTVLKRVARKHGITRCVRNRRAGCVRARSWVGGSFMGHGRPMAHASM